MKRTKLYRMFEETRMLQSVVYSAVNCTDIARINQHVSLGGGFKRCFRGFQATV